MNLSERMVGAIYMTTFQMPFGTLIVSLSPSFNTLKHYNTVCEDYAKRFNILFNPIKIKINVF